MLRQASWTRRLCSLCLHRYPARRAYAAQPSLSTSPSEFADAQPLYGAPAIQDDTPTSKPNGKSNSEGVFDIDTAESKPKRKPRAKALDSEGNPLPERSRGKKDSNEAKESREPKPRKASKSKKEKEDVPRLNPLLPNATDIVVQNQLAWMKAGSKPTLEDINSFRPHSHPRAESDDYPTAYTELVATLCRAFSRDQLASFGALYQLPPLLWHGSRKKQQVAEAIIEEAWEWPSLTKIHKERKDRTEHLKEVIYLDAVQLFAILGKDGVDLLQMSLGYNVHVSVIRQPRLGLLVEGIRGSLKAVKQKIDAIKKAIVTETFVLPSGNPIDSKLIQRLSRLSNTFVQNDDAHPGTVKLMAKDQRHIDVAKRLAAHAVSEYQELAKIPLLAYQPPKLKQTSPVPLSIFPPSYSLYPFLSPRALPWTMTSSGAFRLRRVGEWLGHDAAEDIHITGGLSGGKANIFGPNLQPEDVKAVLLRPFEEWPAAPGRQRVITASLGHLLFSSGSNTQRATLIPPLTGTRPFDRWLGWLKENSGKVAATATFVPSLPVPLLDTPPTTPRMLRRLTYRTTTPAKSPATEEPGNLVAHGSKIIEFEILLNAAQPGVRERPQKLEPENSWTSMESTMSDAVLAPVSEPASASVAEPTLAANSRCVVGTQFDLNLLMPDRPMDMRLTASDTMIVLPEQQPAGLVAYAQQFNNFFKGQGEDPVAPLLIAYEGDTYVLLHSANVRQSHEKVVLKARGFQALGAPPTGVPAISETLFGQETATRSTSCQITCQDWTTETAWNTFLGHCDQLSAAVYQPAKAPPLLLDDDTSDLAPW